MLLDYSLKPRQSHSSQYLSPSLSVKWCALRWWHRRQMSDLLLNKVVWTFDLLYLVFRIGTSLHCLKLNLSSSRTYIFLLCRRGYLPLENFSSVANKSMALTLFAIIMTIFVSDMKFSSVITSHAYNGLVQDLSGHFRS